MKPKFSIIIPVYNVAPYLCECLDSLLAQTFTDWEAICVDDGSTDGSGAILDEYAAKDARLHVIHQKNAGVSVARNVALEDARGEWVGFVDADDVIALNWLSEVHMAAKVNAKIDWVRTGYRLWNEDGSVRLWPIDSVHRFEQNVYFDVADIGWEMLSYSSMLCINIFKREVLQGHRFQVGLKYCEDVCFVADVMCGVRAFAIIPNDGYHYRMRQSSASHNMRMVDVVESLENVLRRWNVMAGRKGAYSIAIKRFIFRCYHQGAVVSRKDAVALRAFLWRALYYGMFSLNRFTKHIRVRWFLFMIFASPRYLFEKAGIRWLIPR